jgi:hypothetical protein
MATRLRVRQEGLLLLLLPVGGAPLWKRGRHGAVGVVAWESLSVGPVGGSRGWRRGRSVWAVPGVVVSVVGLVLLPAKNNTKQAPL